MHPKRMLVFQHIQRFTKRLVCGLVNFVPAVAYLFWLNLPAAFSQPRTSLLVNLCMYFVLKLHAAASFGLAPPCTTRYNFISTYEGRAHCPSPFLTWQGHQGSDKNWQGCEPLICYDRFCLDEHLTRNPYHTMSTNAICNDSNTQNSWKWWCSLYILSNLLWRLCVSSDCAAARATGHLSIETGIPSFTSNGPITPLRILWTLVNTKSMLNPIGIVSRPTLRCMQCVPFMPSPAT